MSGSTHDERQRREFLGWDLARAAQAVAEGEVSSRELTEAALARLEALHPRLNCLAGLEAERALEQADAADAARARGEALGPLHGVPLAHKDMFHRAGRVSACGSRILADFVPVETCTVLARLDAAGAVDLGRLHMAEFALSPTGDNAHHGPSRNPWQPEHISGGSSSGSGAVVAARAVYGAMGSDTGGSVRLPAAFCGVVGIKPTHGRVSRHGLMPLSHSLDQAGPLARTVRDCARLLGVIAGADPRDPIAAAAHVPDYEAGLERPLRRVRVGVAGGYFGEAMDADVRAAMDASRAVLQDLGAELVEVEVPQAEHLQDLCNILQSVEAARHHRRWIAERPQDYGAQVLGRIEPGLYVPATRYLEAVNLRAVLAERVLEEVFGRVDVLHLPTTVFGAPSIAETDLAANPGFREMLFQVARNTRPFNYLGLPALSVPAGFNAAGLPLAMQLVGRPFAEGLLFRVGHAYQQATDWHRRAPAG